MATLESVTPRKNISSPPKKFHAPTFAPRQLFPSTFPSYLPTYLPLGRGVETCTISTIKNYTHTTSPLPVHPRQALAHSPPLPHGHLRQRQHPAARTAAPHRAPPKQQASRAQFTSVCTITPAGTHRLPRPPRHRASLPARALKKVPLAPSNQQAPRTQCTSLCTLPLPRQPRTRRPPRPPAPAPVPPPHKPVACALHPAGPARPGAPQAQPLAPAWAHSLPRQGALPKAPLRNSPQTGRKSQKGVDPPKRRALLPCAHWRHFRLALPTPSPPFPQGPT